MEAAFFLTGLLINSETLNAGLAIKFLAAAAGMQLFLAVAWESSTRELLIHYIILLLSLLEISHLIIYKV